MTSSNRNKQKEERKQSDIQKRKMTKDWKAHRALIIHQPGDTKGTLSLQIHKYWRPDKKERKKLC
jgi:hypothetical protein